MGLMNTNFGQPMNNMMVTDPKPDLAPRRTTMNIDLGNQGVPAITNPVTFDTGLPMTNIMPSVTAPVQPMTAMIPVGGPVGMMDSPVPMPPMQTPIGITSNTQPPPGTIAEVPVTFGKSYTLSSLTKHMGCLGMP